MKKSTFVFLLMLIISISGFSQTIENIDYVSPLNDGVAAIKKGSKWAIINTDGAIVVNFRDDLVSTKTVNGTYPIFNNDRCLIAQNKDGITYFGYIDKTGKTTIEPRFLNALNFENNTAIVLELVKKDAGRNEALGKNIVYYKYFEVAIDINGVIKNYLTQDGVNVVLDKKSLRESPKITSKFISDNLIATMNMNKKWVVKKIE